MGKIKRFDVVLEALFTKKSSNINQKTIKKELKKNPTAKVITKTPTIKTKKGIQKFNVVFEKPFTREINNKTNAQLKTILFEDRVDAKIISKKPHVPFLKKATSFFKKKKIFFK